MKSRLWKRLALSTETKSNGYPLDGIDPLRQADGGIINTLALEESFDGIAGSEAGGFVPPDPTGAAGPNHYVNSVNCAVKIFDKTGNLLAGPTSLGSF